MTFASYTSPVKEAKGKATFLAATKRFYSSIGSVQVRELLVDGDRACALTRYEIRPPTGAPSFTSDVAEIFRVKGDAITSLEIYFDSAPYPK
jgi:ketosteroid isomerase-like protein